MLFLMLAKRRKMIIEPRGWFIGLLLFYTVISAQLALSETGKPLLFKGSDGFVFHFETNGNYSVDMEFYSMATKVRRRMDEGVWTGSVTNRIKMNSKCLLSSPKLAYSCLTVYISTPQSIRFWLPVVETLLSTCTNQVFNGQDYHQAINKANIYRFEEQAEETRTEAKITPPIPRSDFESFRFDLRRQQTAPLWWNVTCELVKEGDTVKLVPEKSKAEAFLIYYRLIPDPADNVETNEFPKLRGDAWPLESAGKN